MPEPTTVAALVALLERRFPPDWAENWDRVGLVLGEPSAPVTRVLCVVDCVPETVEQAVDVGAQLIVAHHPLLLRGVSTLAPTTYKGRIVHRLIRAGIALFAAHTNADVANPGVSDALAGLLGLRDIRPLRPAPDDPSRGAGRVGRLAEPRSLPAFSALVAQALPATTWGVRIAGGTGAGARRIETVAVCGGAGEAYLGDALAAGVDAYLTSDLRHHPASEFACEDGPVLLDAAHWATERPWLDPLAAYLRSVAPVETMVSDIVTDPWTAHVPATGTDLPKEPRT
ncbi:MAG: Nif3-like dinuclear metal center hexameric protein [Dactylosporangium sp.]|nr:Nif3-like dinuclear metal center hexameric protein [Dactylosporangium sp.]NNJ60182.1 Nif3-like dinuclear metal center hexameric protein [Dactylosporangium sp.]